MNYTINASNIMKLLKYDEDTLQKKIDTAERYLAKLTDNERIYKVSLYIRSLYLILVSKKQGKEVNLQAINEMINSATLFSAKSVDDYPSAAPSKR